MNVTSSLFIAFVLGTAGVVVGAVGRALGSRAAVGTFLALAAWFVYVALMSRLGVLRRAGSFPPGPLFILAPIAAYCASAAVGVASPLGGRIASAFPLSLLIGGQAFRLVVELFLHALYRDGVVPSLLTFSGANVDIYVAVSAPIAAVIAARHRHGMAIALAWNLFGLLALANVVTFSVLTAPGPLNLLHTTPSNQMFRAFPFMFIAAFFVPLAVTLHLLAIRTIWSGGHGRPSPVVVTSQS